MNTVVVRIIGTLVNMIKNACKIKSALFIIILLILFKKCAII